MRRAPTGRAPECDESNWRIRLRTGNLCLHKQGVATVRLVMGGTASPYRAGPTVRRTTFALRRDPDMIRHSADLKQLSSGDLDLLKIRG